MGKSFYQGNLTGKKFRAKKGGGWIKVVGPEERNTLMKFFDKWIVQNDEGYEWIMTDSIIRQRMGAPGKKERAPGVPR